MLRGGRGRRALVIGAESFSKLLDWQDRTTCVLFGDGAGAVILEIFDGDSDFGIRSSVLHADGAYRDILYVDGGPSSNQDVGYVRMEGKEVFRHAIEKLAAVMDEALAAADMQPHDIDWLVPHQANIRIIDGMQKKMQLPSEKVVRTVDQHANTSAASIPLALATAVDDGRIKNGDVLAMEAIGGGLVWGAALVKVWPPSMNQLLLANKYGKNVPVALYFFLNVFIGTKGAILPLENFTMDTAYYGKNFNQS